MNLTWISAATNQSLVGSDGTTYSGNSPDATTVTTGFARFTLTEACKLVDNRGFVKIHWPLRVLYGGFRPDLALIPTLTTICREPRISVYAQDIIVPLEAPIFRQGLHQCSCLRSLDG